MFELKRALSSPAHNTSPGPDGISYVLLRHLSADSLASLYVDDLQISCEGSDMRLIERQLQTAKSTALCCQTPLGGRIEHHYSECIRQSYSSRIDYGCVAYGSACNSTLQKLDPVQPYGTENLLGRVSAHHQGFTVFGKHGLHEPGNPSDPSLFSALFLAIPIFLFFFSRPDHRSTFINEHYSIFVFLVIDSLRPCLDKEPVLPRSNVNGIAANTRFLILSFSNNDMSKQSPFAIHKALIGIGGEPNSVKRLRSDSPITISPHKTLNSCRGVISESDLLTTPDAEILDGFSDQGVIQDAKKNSQKARSRKRKRITEKMKEAIIDIKMNPHRPKKPASDESTTDEEEMIVYDVEDEIESNPDYVKENGKTYYKGQLLLTPTKHRK
ncbi:uncharacterized protein TNCV_4965801 [Trichonephila clavipes]|nr:uncharacterized protein TNCV_4965801 [Trichonephila clavipes]